MHVAPFWHGLEEQGASVGGLLGVELGEVDGLDDVEGDAEPVTEGEFDGTLLGSELGELDGTTLGPTLGLDEGTAEGSSDGALVTAIPYTSTSLALRNWLLCLSRTEAPTVSAKV